MNDFLWQKPEIISALKGDIIGEMPQYFTDISIDSRNIKQGAIFFAIKGARYDGHSFLHQAAENGASLLVVDKIKIKEYSCPQNIALLLVEDVLSALEQLAQQARKRSSAKFIAVTGSCGKTTQKELLKFLLSEYGVTHANPGSFNNHWGLPLTLARMPITAKYGVFELGMNHFGEIAKLAEILRPDISIITCIAEAHIGNFANIDEIAQAKAEIFTAQNPNGLVLLNADDKYAQYMAKIAQQHQIKDISFFAKTKKVQYHLLQACFGDKLNLQCELNGKLLDLSLDNLSSSMIYNVLASFACLDWLGLDFAPARHKLRYFSNIEGRGKILALAHPKAKGKNFYVIDESYNANPLSMKNSITDFLQYQTTQRKILILGDMLELGKYSQKMHEDLAHYIDLQQIDKIYLIGRHMRYLAKKLQQKQLKDFNAANIAAYNEGKGALIQESKLELDIENFNNKIIWQENLQDILPRILDNILPNDRLLIKSSNGIKTSLIITAIKDKFNKESR